MEQARKKWLATVEEQIASLSTKENPKYQLVESVAIKKATLENGLEATNIFQTIPPLLMPYFHQYGTPVWQILALLPLIIKDLIKQVKELGYQEIAPDVWVEDPDNVKISQAATLNGPLIIEQGVEIRPGAYLRGNVYVGANSVIGNSSEVKNSILLKEVTLPHYNYVGDSILGKKVHLGAGVVLSNLKLDRKLLTVKVADLQIATGLKKIGSFLADGVEVGCNSVLNPATVVRENSLIYPLSNVRGIFAANSRLKNEKTASEIAF